MLVNLHLYLNIVQQDEVQENFKSLTLYEASHKTYKGKWVCPAAKEHFMRVR